jgi:hypothetical protein
MIRHRWLMAAAGIAVALLQGWDSGVLRAPGWIQAVVMISAVAPSLVWAARASYGLQVAAVALAFVLLTVARMASPTPLPTLHLIAFIPAVLVFVLRGLELRARSVQG